MIEEEWQQKEGSFYFVVNLIFKNAYFSMTDHQNLINFTVLFLYFYQMSDLQPSFDGRMNICLIEAKNKRKEPRLYAYQYYLTEGISCNS